MLETARDRNRAREHDKLERARGLQTNYGSIRHWPYVEDASKAGHDALAADLSCALRLVRSETVLVWRNAQFPVADKLGVADTLKYATANDARFCKGTPEAKRYRTPKRHLSDTMMEAARANPKPGKWWKDPLKIRPDLLTLRYNRPLLDPTIYEIKVSRADFRKDIREKKFRAYHLLSNHLFFAAPAGLIKPDEVPEGCGLIERHNANAEVGWRIAVQAPRTNTFQPTDKFAAALVSRTRDPMPWEPVQ